MFLKSKRLSFSLALSLAFVATTKPTSKITNIVTISLAAIVSSLKLVGKLPEPINGHPLLWLLGATALTTHADHAVKPLLDIYKASYNRATELRASKAQMPCKNTIQFVRKVLLSETTITDADTIDIRTSLADGGAGVSVFDFIGVRELAITKESDHILGTIRPGNTANLDSLKHAPLQNSHLRILQNAGFTPDQEGFVNFVAYFKQMLKRAVWQLKSKYHAKMRHYTVWRTLSTLPTAALAGLGTYGLCKLKPFQSYDGYGSAAPTFALLLSSLAAYAAWFKLDHDVYPWYEKKLNINANNYAINNATDPRELSATVIGLAQVLRTTPLPVGSQRVLIEFIQTWQAALQATTNA
jgi:hypothetical protein